MKKKNFKRCLLKKVKTKKNVILKESKKCDQIVWTIRKFIRCGNLKLHSRVKSLLFGNGFRVVNRIRMIVESDHLRRGKCFSQQDRGCTTSAANVRDTSACFQFFQHFRFQCRKPGIENCATSASSDRCSSRDRASCRLMFAR